MECIDSYSIKHIILKKRTAKKPENSQKKLGQRLLINLERTAYMNFFRKEKQITETVCRECGMEFSETGRMLRHMIKAHSKSGKGPSCKC